MQQLPRFRFRADSGAPIFARSARFRVAALILSRDRETGDGPISEKPLYPTH